MICVLRNFDRLRSSKTWQKQPMHTNYEILGFSLDDSPAEILSHLPFLESLTTFSGELPATLNYLPQLQDYPSLKELTIDTVVADTNALSHQLRFFPCLEKLSMSNCTVEGEYFINAPLHKFRTILLICCYVKRGTQNQHATVARIRMLQGQRNSAFSEAFFVWETDIG